MPGYDADVIVVGAGPVGLSAAIDLAHRGIRTIILERRHRMEPPSIKSNHVSSRTMERFRSWGLADRVRQSGLPASHPHDVCFRTRMTGPEMSRILIGGPEDRARGVRTVDSDWLTSEPPHRINQTFLEPVLFRHAETLSHITIFNDVEYEGFTQSSAGVEARFRRTETGGLEEVRGRFLIGCDGSSSLVRKEIGAKLAGDAIIQHVQSTAIRAPELYKFMTGARSWGYYVYNTERRGHVYTVDGEGLFLVHNHLAAEEYDAGSVSRDSSIRAILGVGPDFPYEIVSEEDWTARRLVADRFRDQRVFICGDAAHLWVPYAGYGMNAGIADALNLTWLLDAVLSGWGTWEMLDAYEKERQPITDQVSRFAMNHAAAVIAKHREIPEGLEADNTEAFDVRAEFGRELYDLNIQQFAAAGLNFGYVYNQSPIIIYDGENAPGYTMSSYTPSTVPGCRLPHAWLSGHRSLYDELGAGYTLVIRDEDADVAAFMDAAARLGIPFAEARETFDAPGYRHRFLISRPDQHVVWRGDRLPEDPASMLDVLRGSTARVSAPDRLRGAVPIG